MTVSELIQKLQEFDPSMTVMLNGFVEIEEVDSIVNRDPYDGDWDNTVVLIK